MKRLPKIDKETKIAASVFAVVAILFAWKWFVILAVSVFAIMLLIEIIHSIGVFYLVGAILIIAITGCAAWALLPNDEDELK
jgi:hypothetical protein